METLKRKLRSGKRVLKDQGFLGLSITALQFIQKHTRGHGKTSRKHHINMVVRRSDLLQANLQQPLPAWKGTSKERLTLNWLMPPPGKGSGGHTTLFRFIKYLEDAGHTCNIYLYADVKHPAPIEAIERSMGDSFAPVKAKMQWLKEGDEFSPCDGLFATSWETAYAVFNAKVDARKLYFVQDFEPYFYPVGSYYSLAENTYKMGLYGVTAGNFLTTKLRRDYGMKADYFDFGADKSVYYFENTKKRKEIMFYVRPYTSRRGFELGVMALVIFHEKHPDYAINFIGWDVAEYDVPFPYNNLKILTPEELNTVYNRCAAGLVLSMTNMSLLPLELLSSGTIPVVNEGENNRLVSDNPYIAYADCDPRALADELCRVVERDDQTYHATKAAASVPENSWDVSGARLVSIVEKAVKEAA